MTISLKSFDEKIAELKQKKKDLEAKQAKSLLKYLSSEIGDEFSPQLAACVMQECWKQANRDQKEKWLKAAKTFRFSKSQKTQKTTSKSKTSSEKNREAEA